MTDKIKSMIKKKCNLSKKFLNSNKSHDYQKYLLWRNQCNKVIYERRLSKERKSNSKYFGKYIRSKMKTNTGPLLRKD